MANKIVPVASIATRFGMNRIGVAFAGAVLISLAAQPAASQTGEPPQLQPASKPNAPHPAKPAPAKLAPQPRPKPKPKPVAAQSEPASPSQTPSGDGQTATLETTRFENWTVTCQSQGAAVQPRRCVARIAVLRSKADPRPILFGLISREGASWRLTLQVPTSTMVKPGVKLTFGNGTARQFDITSCEPALCTAEGTLEASALEEFKASPSAVVTWSTIGLGEAIVEFALGGIAPAVAHLEKR